MNPNRRTVTYVVITLAALAFIVFGALSIRQNNIEDQRRQEAAMRSAITSIRHAIQAYTTKHGRGPQSFAELVSSRELPVLPADPVTKSNTTWRPVTEERVSVDDFQTTSQQVPAVEVVDVRSGAAGADSTGKPWSDY